jgi:hypothetical protein
MQNGVQQRLVNIYFAVVFDETYVVINESKLAADSDLIRPGVPTRSRPGFRFEAGHRSEINPATIPI